VGGRYDERYAWRYTVRAAHGRNAGANLDRRGEVWRYRRRLPADLRERAGKFEIVRGLARITLAEALAEVRHLNAQVDAIVQVARSDLQADIAIALRGVHRGARSLPGGVHLCRPMPEIPGPDQRDLWRGRDSGEDGRMDRAATTSERSRSGHQIWYIPLKLNELNGLQGSAGVSLCLERS
jgi:hypothetical protein